ncbi:MAG: radical SAM protein [Lachnospiraceae bacterium]|nr:radical SAM protein [Lachnospiraceae bacterium]
MDNKPIGFLFVLKSNYFYYDTYRNRLIQVTVEQFKEIKRLLEIGQADYLASCDDTEEQQAIVKLIHMGFFRPSFIACEEHPNMRYIPQLLNRCVNFVQLQVTRSCNFRCRYCFFANDNTMTRNHENAYMDWDTARRSIDFLYEHSCDVSEVGISFYGGEPFLNFAIIKKAVEYAEKKFLTKMIRFSATTNGSIMDQDIADFLAEKGFHLMISLDGPADIQDSHRRFSGSGGGTFDKVLENIMLLKASHEDYFYKNVIFNPVMFADESYAKVLAFFKSIGVRESAVRKQYANMKGIDYNYDLFHSDIAGTSEYEHFQEYNVDQIEHIKDAYKRKFIRTSEELPESGCIPGVVRLLITVHGEFYPCEKINENEELMIGNLRDGFNEEQVRRIANLQKLTHEQCKTCWAVRFCKMCAIHCTDPEKGNISRQAKEAYCRVIKKIAVSFLKEQAERQNQEV